LQKNVPELLEEIEEKGGILEKLKTKGTTQEWCLFALSLS
jgi:hypothetical protein